MNVQLLALLMGVFSAIMWLIESKEFISFIINHKKKLKEKENPSLKDITVHNLIIVANLPMLSAFALDLFITVSLLSLLGVGGGLGGALLGLGVSNVFSIFILGMQAVISNH